MPPKPWRSSRGGNRSATGSRPPANANADDTWQGRRPHQGTNFELIASVSRSSGLENDGDTLKDFTVQEEYRDFVQGKLNDYWKRYPRTGAVSEADAKRRAELEANVLIQFRKLREGIFSSKRCDIFAIEVYETSLHLSVIFRSHAQTTSVLSHLLPDLYDSASPTSSSPATTVLLAEVHSLVVHFPSQRQFLDLRGTLESPFTLPSYAETWIQDVSRCLRRSEYPRLDELTRFPIIKCLVADLSSKSPKTGPDLREDAIVTLVDSLRVCARTAAWRMIRNAYREFTLPVSNTRPWLNHSLLLVSISVPQIREKEAAGGEKDVNDDDVVDLWLSSREKLGEVGKKEGVEGRWVVKIKK